MRIRQVEFPSTVKADFVRAVFDREHATEVTVPAAKEELKDPKQQFHTSYALTAFATSVGIEPFEWRPLARATAIAPPATL